MEPNTSSKEHRNSRIAAGTVLRPTAALFMLFLFIACGGGGGGGGSEPTDDNSRFFGTYHAELPLLSDCTALPTLLHAGDDANRIGDDDYIYIPRSGTAFNGTGQNPSGQPVSVTVGLSGNRVSYRRQCGGNDLRLTASFDAAGLQAAVSGLAVTDNPTNPDNRWGKLYRGILRRNTDTPAELRLDRGRLQRLGLSGGGYDYLAWLELSRGGLMIGNGEVAGMSLYFGDQPISCDPAMQGKVSVEAFIPGRWSDGAAAPTFGGLAFVSAMGAWIDAASLETGDYTLRVTPSQGTAVDYPVHFSGNLDLPVPDASWMNHAWLPDGRLRLTWQNPEDDGYNRVRATLRSVSRYDNNGLTDTGILEQTLLEIDLPSTVQEVTVPADILAEIQASKAPLLLTWHLQTLACDTPENGGNEHAVSAPADKAFSFKPGVRYTASGAWEETGVSTITVTVDTSTFPADTTCGPKTGAQVWAVDRATTESGERLSLIDQSGGGLLDFVCWRFPGDPPGDDFTGRWYAYRYTDDDVIHGNVYAVTITGETLTVEGLISVCYQ